MEFKIGDKVKRKKGSGSCIGTYKGIIYTFRTDGYIGTEDGKGDCNCFENWELVKETTKLMTKLNSMMKRLLDADTKKLIKGGLINGDLQLTEEGREALLSIVFEEKKADLVKIAEENIEEAQKEKCC